MNGNTGVVVIDKTSVGLPNVDNTSDATKAVLTSTALAANPADCGADTYATTIAASGALTCSSITNASTTATATNTASTIVLRDGSGNFSAGAVTASSLTLSSPSSAMSQVCYETASFDAAAPAYTSDAQVTLSTCTFSAAANVVLICTPPNDYSPGAGIAWSPCSVGNADNTVKLRYSCSCDDAIGGCTCADPAAASFKIAVIKF